MDGSALITVIGDPTFCCSNLWHISTWWDDCLIGGNISILKNVITICWYQFLYNTEPCDVQKCRNWVVINSHFNIYILVIMTIHTFCSFLLHSVTFTAAALCVSWHTVTEQQRGRTVWEPGDLSEPLSRFGLTNGFTHTHCTFQLTYWQYTVEW